MSLRSQIKREGDYPSGLIPTNRVALKIDNHTIIQTIYETNSDIDIYLGGVKRWCIHCVLHKENNKIKEKGFLVKIRYDMLCSVEEKIHAGGDTPASQGLNFAVGGGDIKKLLQLLIQYIHDIYPDVKYLSFSDLSIRRCDNELNVNLAVMTYLYSGKTWYEKNFDVTIAEQSKDTLDKIIKIFNKSKINTPWSVIKNTIYNYKELPFTEKELETLYDYKELPKFTEQELEEVYKDVSFAETKGITLTSWKDFFEPIFNRIGIVQFCIFISPWLDMFISQYFNNLMGLSYDMPIKPTNIEYTKSEFVGGRHKSFFKGARKNKTIKRFSEME